jgi:hypothetical protein
MQHNERREYATPDAKVRRRPGRRLVKLPGESGHVERSDSAVYLARKLDIDKRERRMKAAARHG